MTGSSPRPVCFIAECSSSIGLGHLKRCVALARQLQSLRPVSFELIGSDSASVEQLPADELSGFAWKWIATPAFPDTRSHVIDVTVGTQQTLAESRPSGISRSVGIDWFDPCVLPAVSVNLLDADGTMQAAYARIGARRRFFGGADFALLRQEIREQPFRPVDTQTAPNLLLSFGGADPSNCTRQALIAIQPALDLLGQSTVILGPLYPKAAERDLSELMMSSAVCLRSPSDFPQRLANADIVMCGGGGTLLESLYLGRPTVVFPQNGLERAHAQEHARAEACVLVERLMHVIVNGDTRRTLSVNARRRVDGKGLNRVVSIILDM